MGRPQASFTKRQREQAKRDKRLLKAEKKTQRQTDAENGIDSDMAEPVGEETIDDAEVPYPLSQG